MGSEAKKVFAVMAKPVGSICNMRCSYCYYLGTDSLSLTPELRVMPDELLDKFVREYIEDSAGPVVSFTWHGGEPTLAGIDFFRRAVQLQKKYLPAGWECWNNLQTNGLLLNNEWCSFLSENRFDVGLSIDGSRFVHDKYRLDAAGKGTFERVTATVERLLKNGVRPDLLCTVTSDAAQRPLEVYRGLRDMNTGWIQFIPIVRWKDDGTVTEDSVTPEGYGRFLCDIFDQWIMHDLDRTQVQLFAETASVLNGGVPGLCWMAPECGRVLILEKDGNIYSCDHFVDKEHLLGNLSTDRFDEVLELPEQIEFGKNKKETLTDQCRRCQWLPMCGGGCPKDRYLRSKDGEPGQYYLCSGLEMFFSHSVPKLNRLLLLQKNGKKLKEIMETFRAEEQARWAGVGRNDPCPCGSGKKAKNCCWYKRP